MNENREAGVQDMLRARDARAERQKRMLQAHGRPLISFTMNIAGSIKTDPLIRRAFFEGADCVTAMLKARRAQILQDWQTLAFTGDEWIWAVDAPARELKVWMCAIEETHPLGRLFDLDVLDETGGHLTRTERRKCIICGGDVHICARSRAHSARALYLRAGEMIRAYFDVIYARRVGMCAQRALLCEAVTTPKPGLVDAHDSGAHRDMNLLSFMSGAAALRPWFEESARIGGMRLSDADTFARLRAAGLRAEGEMLRATDGVNTHKGALFSMGILCCAAGRLGEGATAAEILRCAARIAAPVLADLSALNSENAATGGERQYLEMGLGGARGEAAAGFPTVAEIGLPALRAARARGADLENAGLNALVAMMAEVQDSNILRRRGAEALCRVQTLARELQTRGFVRADLERMNEEFVRENISPGGSADLLALTYFLYMLCEENGGVNDECNA